MGTRVLAGNASAQLAQRQRSSAECSTSASAFSSPDLMRSHSMPRSKPPPAAWTTSPTQQLSRSRSTTNCLLTTTSRSPSISVLTPFVSSRSVICAASSTLTRQPLSVYKWPQRRPAILEWLDHCVQDAVRQLDRAPFVQLIYAERADPLETHHASRTETGSSDLRQKVAGLLANNKPDALIFVHSLPSHVSERPSHSEQTVSASSVLTGFAAHQALDQRGLQHGKSARHDVLAGKVGECCDDASTHLQNQILPFSRPHDAPLPSSDSRHTASHSVEQTTDYWGLVVQSKHHSEAEGYYVLKTVRNTNPVGCQCTHYTLTQMQ